MSDVKEVLQQLSDDDIISIMQDLGANLYEHKDNEMIFYCVCHDDLEKHKLYCYKGEEGYNFYCYICLFSGNIISLLMHINRCEFKEAFRVLQDKTGIYSSYSSRSKIGFGQGNQMSSGYWSLLSSYKSRKKAKVELPVFSEKVLGTFSYGVYHYSWVNDHIEWYAMDKFQIGMYVSQQCITIPHRDIEGNFIGLRKRSLLEEEVSRGFKYMPMSISGQEYAHPLAFNLYGLYENKECIQRIKKICLFEAEKSCLQVESYYPDNNWSLAVCGSNLSNAQRDLIVSLGVNEVILCMDRDWENDSEYVDKKYALFKRKYMKMAQKLIPYVNVYIIEKGMIGSLELKDSPSDKGKEIFESLLKQKRLLTPQVISEYLGREY